MSSPDVAVVIPVHDAAEHLPAALASIEAQTTDAVVEVVVVDDGSTDASAEVARDFAARHPHVQVLQQENAGPGAARNRGVRATTAPLVTFLDADDELTPRSLEVRLAAMSRPGVDLVVSNYEFLPEGQAWMHDVLVPDRVVDGLAEVPRLLENLSVWNKVFPRSFFDDERNLFLEGFIFEDSPVSVSALLTARRIALVAEPCYRYRRVSGSGSLMDDPHSRPENFEGHMVINEALLERFGDDPEALALLDRFFVRSVVAFLEKAPAVLDDDGVRTFFHRWQALFAGMTPERIAPFLTRVGAKVPFYALLDDDLALFSDPSDVVTGVTRVDGVPHLVLDRPVRDELLPLLRLRPALAKALGQVTVHAEHLRVDGGHLHADGTVTTSVAVAVAVPPVGFELELSLGKDGPRVPVRVEPVDGVPHAARWSADLPLDEVPAGSRGLALVSPLYQPQVRHHVLLDEATAVELGPEAPRDLVVRPSKEGRAVVERVQRRTGLRRLLRR